MKFEVPLFNMTLQNIIILIMVIISASYITRRMYRNMKHDGTKEGCAKCDTIKENKKALDAEKQRRLEKHLRDSRTLGSAPTVVK